MSVHVPIEKHDNSHSFVAGKNAGVCLCVRAEYLLWSQSAALEMI